MNTWVEQYLQNWVNGRQDNWADYLPLTEFAHNSWKHETLGKSPYELITGVNPTIQIEIPQEDTVPAANNRLVVMKEAREQADQIATKQTNYNKPIPEIPEGMEVWLNGKNLKLATGTKKLAPKRYGPFKILKKISKVAYKLLLPTSMRIHDIFHFDLLTPFTQTETYGPAYSRPTPDLIDDEEHYKIEEVIDARCKGRGKKLEYLVHWKGYPASERSWVTANDQTAANPHLLLHSVPPPPQPRNDDLPFPNLLPLSPIDENKHQLGIRL